MYEKPDSYTRKHGKLVATSSRLLLAEKQINASFRDVIPWCMPPTYGDVEMKGAFPSIETCRLQALCSTMTKNIGVFTAEFNAHRQVHGVIIVNLAGEELSEEFKTRKILEASADYARTQVFNDYANKYFMATAFTVLYLGASIHPHFGPTNYKYRIHLCIDIDGVCGIVTAHGTRFWRVGKDGNYEIHITIDRHDCHLLCLFIGVFTLAVLFNSNKRGGLSSAAPS